MYFKRKLICTMGSVTSVVLLTHILNKRAVGLPVADPELANGGGPRSSPAGASIGAPKAPRGGPLPRNFFDFRSKNVDF